MNQLLFSIYSKA